MAHAWQARAAVLTQSFWALSSHSLFKVTLALVSARSSRVLNILHPSLPPVAATELHRVDSGLLFRSCFLPFCFIILPALRAKTR